VKRIKAAYGYAVLAAFALYMGGCSVTSNPQMQLIGNVENPAAPVLSYDCVTNHIANSCTNYNTIADACAHGLPIQGVAASDALDRFCRINGYAQSGTPTYISWTPAPAAAAKK